MAALRAWRCKIRIQRCSVSIGRSSIASAWMSEDGAAVISRRGLDGGEQGENGAARASRRRQRGGAGVVYVDAGRTPRWTAEALGELRRLVRTMGHDWTSVSEKLGVTPGAAEQRWRRTPAAWQREALVWTAALEQVGCGPAVPRGAEKEMPPLRMDLGVETKRRRGHGRGWTSCLDHNAEVVLEPRPFELAVVAEMEAQPGWEEGTRAVSVEAERQRRAGGRPYSGGVGKGQKLQALQSTRCKVPLVCVDAVGWCALQPAEAALLMGMRRTGESWRAAERAWREGRVTARELWAMVADSLDARSAAVCIDNALDMMAEEGVVVAGPVIYCGMFAGGLDAWAAALRAHEGVVGVVYRAAAELDAKRRGIIQDAYHVPDSAMWSRAERMAAELVGVADWVCASPPCGGVSKARRVLKEDKEADARVVRVETLQHFEAVVTMMRRLGPRVVMIEISESLRTHHADLYAEVQQMLLAVVGYRWRHGSHDCATARAAHHRGRALWVAVREAGC